MLELGLALGMLVLAMAVGWLLGAHQVLAHHLGEHRELHAGQLSVLERMTTTLERLDRHLAMQAAAIERLDDASVSRETRLATSRRRQSTTAI